MSDIAIRVEHLSKRYRIRQGVRPRYETLYDNLSHALQAPFHRLWSAVRRRPAHSPQTTDDGPSSSAVHRPSPNDEFIWALKDVSFEVKRGEVVGIIGRNGAGKTTLLKVLSRITEPTEGYAEVRGRVGSLLEVGTGFHPELTGRENIYLNGAILGMKKAEIDRKFDEIVAFAEIEKFLDTPVKFYSSGMYVRLAFAVAAHLDPEILLVDEVLAVGDAAFQKKCLGKMGDVAAGGRTVLFVSHRMTAVKTLCTRSFWLDSGQIVKAGETQDVVASYLSGGWAPELSQSWSLDRAPGNEVVRLLGAEVRPLNGSQILMGDPLELHFTVAKMTSTTYRLDVTFHLVDEMGTLVFVGSTGTTDIDLEAGSGLYRFVCRIPPHLMHEGTYTITRFLVLKDRGRCLYEHRDLLRFQIDNPGQRHLGWMGKKEGVVRPRLDWHVERSPL